MDDQRFPFLQVSVQNQVRNHDPSGNAIAASGCVNAASGNVDGASGYVNAASENVDGASGHVNAASARDSAAYDQQSLPPDDHVEEESKWWEIEDSNLFINARNSFLGAGQFGIIRLGEVTTKNGAKTKCAVKSLKGKENHAFFCLEKDVGV